MASMDKASCSVTLYGKRGGTGVLIIECSCFLTSVTRIQVQRDLCLRLVTAVCPLLCWSVCPPSETRDMTSGS